MRKMLLILLAIVVLAAGAFIGVRHWANQRAGVSSTAIPAANNAVLSATVFKPKGAGSHPLIVMPTAWGAKQSEYLGLGGLFAGKGFLVVAYTQRGFNASTGQIDFAGPNTIGDVSTVIDWAIQHQSADVNHIGVLGQSYGAGVALLAAEHDSRIKAVVALSTWSTWGGTFIENGTLVSRTLASLIGGGSTPNRRLDSEMTTLALEFSTQPAAAMSLITKLSAVRSPITNVAALNKNKTAVMLANGFQDSLLNPRQAVDLYGKLTGPKRLQLGTGDHGQVEAGALVAGKPIGPIANALKWMQHYLQGADNGIQSQAPIQVQDGKTGAIRDLAAWPTLAHAPTTTLGVPVGAKNYGSGTHWSVLLGAGRPTVAAAPLEQLTLTQPYRFASTNLSSVDPLVGLRWDEPAVSAPLVLQGSARVTFALTGNEPAGSVFAYLYDVSPSGAATLITVAPDSLTGLSKNSARGVTILLTPTAWTVPAGDHVALVLGAGDAKWTSLGQVGGVLGVSSSSAHPATLTLPTA